MKIGKYIYKYRQEHGMTMQEFANKAGLSKGYVSMLEKGVHPQNGKEIVPSIETFNKVAKAMGITIDSLIAGVDPNQKVMVGSQNSATDDPKDFTQPIDDFVSRAKEYFRNEQDIFEAAAGNGRICDSSPTDTVSLCLEADQKLVLVRGRSMEPTIQDGDTVVVSAQSILDYPRQIALVKVNGEDHTIKRVEIKDDGLLLLADNIDVYPPHFYTEKEVQDLPVTIEGVVVKLIRDIL